MPGKTELSKTEILNTYLALIWARPRWVSEQKSVGARWSQAAEPRLN